MKCKEFSTLKLRIIVILDEGRVYDWDRTHGGTSGVNDNVLFLDLDGGNGDFTCVCPIILY